MAHGGHNGRGRGDEDQEPRAGPRPGPPCSSVSVQKAGLASGREWPAVDRKLATQSSETPKEGIGYIPD